MFWFTPSFILFMGLCALVAAVRAYRLGKQDSRFVELVIVPLVGGVALLLIGTLGLLGVLTEAWSSASANVIFAFLVLTGMILEGRRLKRPGVKIAFMGTTVIVAILFVALCYLSIIRACRC